MSDHAIRPAMPEATPGAGGEVTQGRATAAPQPEQFAPSCAPAAAPPQEEGGEGSEASHAADNAASLHTLLETAVTCRSVEEVADLVALLRRSGQLPDAADQALRAAAVNRPVEDVLALVLLLGKDNEPQLMLPSAPHQGPETLPGPEPQYEPECAPQSQSQPGRGAGGQSDLERRPYRRVSRKRGARPSREVQQLRTAGSAPGRALRWPVAMALAVSAFLCVPRNLSLLVQGGSVTCLLLGLAGLCLALGVLVTVSDRVSVWSAATATGIGIVVIHALAAAMDLDLWDGAVGGLLPWPTGASMLAGGLVAALSVMALLYRSDRPQPEPDAPAGPAPEAGADRVETAPGSLAVGLAPDPAREAEVTSL